MRKFTLLIDDKPEMVFMGFDRHMVPAPSLIALVQEEDCTVTFALDNREGALLELKRYLRVRPNSPVRLIGIYQLREV